MLLPLKCRLNTNLLLDFFKLTGYFAFAVNVVSSNPCVSPSPRITISWPFYKQTSSYQLQK